MCEINTNINERSEKGENEVPDIKLSLPADVYNKGDNKIDRAEDEIEEATSFEPFENEQEYKSKEIVSREAENEIAAFRRAKMERFGGKTLKFVRVKKAEYERAA